MSDLLMTKTLMAWRFLYRRGFIEGFGHISVRLPGADRFMVTPISPKPAKTTCLETARTLHVLWPWIVSDVTARRDC